MLARLFTFTGGTTILSAQVNAELDQIVQLLSGIGLNQTSLKHNAAATTLTVDNTGGGVVTDFKVAGVVKAKVNAVGQFESALATGTAPLVIASTTNVPNLNSDTVDGKHAADLLLAVAPVISEATSVSQLDYTQAAGTLRVRNNATGLDILNQTAGTTLFSVDKTTKVVTVYAGLVGVTPTAAAHLTRKDYVDGRKVAFSVRMYQASPSAAAQFSALVVPAGVSNFTIRALRVVVSTSSTGGSMPQMAAKRYDSAGSLLSTSASLAPSFTNGFVKSYSTTLGSPIACSVGDSIVPTITVGGTNTSSDLVWIVEGDYTLG